MSRGGHAFAARAQRRAHAWCAARRLQLLSRPPPCAQTARSALIAIVCYGRGLVCTPRVLACRLAAVVAVVSLSSVVMQAGMVSPTLLGEKARQAHALVVDVDHTREV